MFKRASKFKISFRYKIIVNIFNTSSKREKKFTIIDDTICKRTNSVKPYAKKNRTIT